MTGTRHGRSKKSVGQGRKSGTLGTKNSRRNRLAADCQAVPVRDVLKHACFDLGISELEPLLRSNGASGLLQRHSPCDSPLSSLLVALEAVDVTLVEQHKVLKKFRDEFGDLIGRLSDEFFMLYLVVLLITCHPEADALKAPSSKLLTSISLFCDEWVEGKYLARKAHAVALGACCAVFAISTAKGPSNALKGLHLFGALLALDCSKDVVREMPIDQFTTCVHSAFFSIQKFWANASTQVAPVVIRQSMEVCCQSVNCLIAFLDDRGFERMDILGLKPILTPVIRICCAALTFPSLPRETIIPLGRAAWSMAKTLWILQGSWDDGVHSAELVCEVLRGEAGLDEAGKALALAARPDLIRDGNDEARSSSMNALSTLAICRGILSFCSDKVLSSHVLSREGEETCLFVSTFNDVILAICHFSGDQIVRIEGLQVASSFLSRLVGALDSDLLRNFPKQTLTELANSVLSLLLLSWESTSKRALDLLPALLSSLLDLEILLDPENDGLAMRQLFNQILAQPEHRKGKYAAIGVILSKYGAEVALRVCPQLLSILISVVVSHRGASKAANICLAQVMQAEWTQVAEIGKASSIVLEWVSEIVGCLLSSDSVTHQRVVDLCLDDAISQGKDLALNLLCGALREELGTDDDKQVGASLENKFRLSRYECISFSLISLGILARKYGITVHMRVTQRAGVDDTQGQQVNLLSDIELRNGCMHRDPSLRIAALTFIVKGFSKSSLPAPGEISIFRDTLFFSLKCPDAEECPKFIRLMKDFIARLTECSRASRKDRKMLAVKELCANLVRWVCREVTQSLYPGTPFPREVVGLQLLLTFGQMLCWPAESLGGLSPDIPRDLMEAASDELNTHHVLYLLFGLMTSTWDATRGVCQKIILLIPPLLDSKSVHNLCHWALQLTNSSNQTEHDAGALALSTIFSIYCERLNWKLALRTQLTSSVHTTMTVSVEESGCAKPEAPISGDSGYSNPSISFLESLLAAIDVQVSQLRSAAESMEIVDLEQPRRTEVQKVIPTPQGLVCALRYILRNLDLGCIARLVHKDARRLETWKRVTSMVVDSLMSALHLSLQVLSRDEESSPVEDSDPSYRSCGPMNPQVHAQPANAPTQIDCRGHVVLSSPMEIGSENPLGDFLPNVVMSCWLLIKETSLALGELVVATPLDVSSPTKNTSFGLLTASHVDSIGSTAVFALLRLRHMGAVAFVQDVLQNLASACLSIDDEHHQFSIFPMEWQGMLLRRMRDESGQFILRRSTGFAYAFQALLRAEQKVSRNSELFHNVLTKLLDYGSAASQESWRCRIHAMNVLRLIFNDSTLSHLVQYYASKATQVALLGFDDSMWAVRNSSTMLYASIIRRLCKDKVTDARIKGITVTTFFSLYPDLLQFLLCHLNRATELSLGGSIHPMLQPILMLLCQLRSSSSNSQDPGAESSAAALFVPCLLRASCARHAMARSMAARALSCLVSRASRPRILESILSDISPDPGCLAVANATHGALLQVFELLKAYRTEEMNEDVGDGDRCNYNVIFRLLLDRGWLANPDKCPCPPIRRLSLEILSLALHLRDNLLTADMGELYIVSLTSNIKAAVFSGDSQGVLLPGEPLLTWETAAKIILSSGAPHCLGKISSELMNPCTLMRSELMEVRMGACAGILELLDTTFTQESTILSMISDVHKTAVDIVQLGKSCAPHFQLLLKILCRTSSLLLVSKFIGWGGGVAKDHLSHLASIYPELLNYCSRCLSSSSDPSHAVVSPDALVLTGYGILSSNKQHTIMKWQEVIWQASEPQYSPSIRRAATEAILIPIRNLPAIGGSYLQLKLSLLKLSQDEDDYVRDLAHIACCLAHNTGVSKRSGYVEGKSISTVFESLEASYPGLKSVEKLSFLTAITGLMHREASGSAQVLDEAISASRAGRAKIFGVDDANLHADLCMITQHAFRWLAKLDALALDEQQSFSKLSEWSHGVVHNALFLVEAMCNEYSSERRLWPGGLSYHPQFFNKAFVILAEALALRVAPCFAFLRASHEWESLGARLMDACRAFQAMPAADVHPILRGLVYMSADPYPPHEEILSFSESNPPFFLASSIHE